MACIHHQVGELRPENRYQILGYGHLMNHNNSGRHFRIALVVFLAIQGLAFTPQQVVRAADWSPAPKPANFAPAWHPICTTDTQLDCLESIGAYINGTLVKGTPTGRVENNSSNNSTIPEWKIPGLVNEDGKDLVQTQLRSRELPGGQIGMSIEMYVSSQDGFRPKWESSRTDCTFKNSQGQCFRFGNPQTGIKYVATFRSSWILPNIVSGSLEDATTQVEKLPQSGASRVTVAGVPMKYLLRDNALNGQKDEAGLAILKWFRFDVTDGRFLPRPWECLDSAPPLVFGNGVGGGSAPTFTDKKLDFKVSSPHFEPDGVTLFIGSYNATIPAATAECMWKSKVTQSQQLAIEVFESETGTAQTSTTSVEITADAVKIRSTGFTYSNKTVRVGAAPEPVVAPAKPSGVKTSASKGTIKVSFKTTAGVTYKVIASKGSAKKTLKCKSSATSVSCTATKVSKGAWKISITPRTGTTDGPSATTTVRMR